MRGKTSLGPHSPFAGTLLGCLAAKSAPRDAHPDLVPLLLPWTLTVPQLWGKTVRLLYILVYILKIFLSRIGHPLPAYLSVVGMSGVRFCHK